MPKDERTYMLALIRGDKEGLNRVFKKHRAPIFHYCLKLLKDRSLAQEATADVFIKIWEKRQIIDPNRSIQPLLYKIARDTAYSYLRKIASEEKLKKNFLENYAPKVQQDGEWLYIRKEHTAQVARIIEDLPMERQRIFRMRYFDGKDNPNIARELNLSIHTVKSQLVKARAFVRSELETRGVLITSILLGLFLFWH